MKWLICLIAIATTQTSAILAQPARILLIRHAEKPAKAENPHLSLAGRQHANVWMGYFTNSTDRLPDFLFAPRPSEKHPSLRPIETLEPLAHHLGKPIETPFGSVDYAKLSQQLLTDPRFKGKTVAICWVHQSLPQFVASLGVDPEPEPWMETVYDKVYTVTFDNGKAQLATSRFRFKTRNPKALSDDAE